MADVPWWADPDPWAFSPEEPEAHDRRRRERQERMAALAETDPPF